MYDIVWLPWMILLNCKLYLTCSHCSVPARPISEGAAPCPYWLAPCPYWLASCPIYKRPARIINKQKFKQKNYNFFFSPIYKMQLLLCFQTADVKMLVLADLCPCFYRSHSKLCPILCRLRTELCPNFGRSRARLCPIYFAPRPFLNLAGTL